MIIRVARQARRSSVRSKEVTIKVDEDEMSEIYANNVPTSRIRSQDIEGTSPDRDFARENEEIGHGPKGDRDW